MSDQQPQMTLEVTTTREDVVLILRQAGHAMEIPLAPQTAFECGEKMARAAHSVKFPGEPLPEVSYIAAQVRARTTDEVRGQAIQRLTNMITSDYIHEKKAPARMAEAYVDAILNLFGVK